MKNQIDFEPGENTYRGWTAHVEQDEEGGSPREWDNLGIMACWHEKYNLGDKGGVAKLEQAIRESKAYRESWDNPSSDAFKDLDYPAALIQAAEACGITRLPLYLYDHSGLTINTTGFSCQWDSGQVGVIFVTDKKIRDEYSRKRINKGLSDLVLEHLKGEVKTYDQYLTNDVWWYSVERGGTELDSCGGFYGFEYACEEARKAVDNEIGGGS